MLGNELWEDDFNSLLSIVTVKEFIVDVWESRKLIIVHKANFQSLYSVHAVEPTFFL